MTEPGTERIDCAVIGAGVVGLAVARALARSGREVLVLEAGAMVGGGISSRNSEVVHAGMYYPAGSLKALLCVRGNRLLRDFAAAHGVAFSMCGKLIVATNAEEEAKLADILAKGRVNGVTGLAPIAAAEAMALEPRLACTAALFSADTGIVDVHGLMLALQGSLEAHGGAVVLHAPVTGGRAGADGVLLEIGGADPMRVRARSVVVAAGLSACPLARSLGLANVPR